MTWCRAWSVWGEKEREMKMRLLKRAVTWFLEPFTGHQVRQAFQRVERELEPWQDARITEHELHRANEEMCFAGDSPWYDACDEVGDGHIHLVPSGLSAESMAE